MKKISLIILATLVLCFFFISPEKTHKKKLQFLSWGSESEVKVIHSLIEEYELKNPQVDVEFIHAPANYFQKLHLLIASNLVPDVVFINNINSELYLQNNVFENLNPYIYKDKDFKIQDYFEGAIKAFSRNDKLYAIPRDVSNLVVYYNKSLFEKYGIQIPSKDWTYQDFLETAKKLTKDVDGDGKTDIYGFGFEEKPIFWLPFLWSQGGGFLDNQGNIIIKNQASIEGLEFYSDLRNKHKVSPSRSEIASLTTAQMFMNAQVAMHISGRWNVPRYRQDIQFDWDVINFPNGKCGSVVDSDASGWAIAKQSENKELAWDLIKFLASKENSKKFAKSGLIIPARKDVANSKMFLDGQPESSHVYIYTLENAIPTPVLSNYNELLDKLNIELEYLWTGKRSVNEVVENFK